MNIAVCGAGITGTTVAFLLSEQGHSVTIFEQAEQCRPVGAGVMLQTSGQHVLERLGLMADLASVSTKLSGMTALQVSGKILVDLDFSKLGDEYFAYGVHRGHLFSRLLERCRQSNIEIKNGICVTDFAPERRELRSESGESFGGFDFVIATDGSRSSLRANCGIKASVKQYKHAAMWITGRCDYQPGKLVQVVRGTTKLVGLLPIGEGQTSFFWGLPIVEWNRLQDQSIESWRDEVLAMCPEAESLVRPIQNFSEFAFGTYRNVAMKRWHTDHIVFLGDAAHATSPHLGQGVNLALEDAIAFADAMKATGDFRKACDLFTAQRIWKLRYYQQLTRWLSPFFQSDGSIRGLCRDAFLPWIPHVPFVGREMLRTLCGQKNGWLR